MATIDKALPNITRTKFEVPGGKGQEIQLPPSLTMILPRDYVNYVKLARVDANGIEHRIYPIKDTSNPFRIKQRASGEYNFDIDDELDLKSLESLIKNSKVKYKNFIHVK